MTNVVPRINGIPTKSGNDNSKAAFNEALANGQNYVVDRIKTPPRCTLPLQTLNKVSRHITVLQGCLHVTLGDDVLVLVPDESIYIPQGVLHGIENRANESAEIISVDFNG